MLVGLLVVTLAQFLPYDAGSRWLDTEYVSRRDTYGASHDGSGRAQRLNHPKY